MTLVLTNRVLNAIEAMPKGGTVSLGLNTENGCAVISIADTGGGMWPEVVPDVSIPL